MNWFILVTGLIYSCRAEELSDFEDVFSFLTNSNNKHISKSNSYKPEKNPNGKSGIIHEPFGMGFPPVFPPLFFDSMPISNSAKKIADEKDMVLENANQKDGLSAAKQKKKPKEKVIMSFTEFFVPFKSHKTFDYTSFPKKFDFFDNFFKNFGFRDIEEPILKSTRDKIPINTNKTKFEGTIVKNDVPNNKSKGSEMLKTLGSLFHKPRDTEILLFNSGIDNEKEAFPECCGNLECNRRCQTGLCTDQLEMDRKNEFDKDNDYFAMRTAIKQEGSGIKKEQSDETKLDKLMRLSLLYTIPILIGIGGVILALGILRRDSTGKQNQLIKEYDPIQHC